MKTKTEHTSTTPSTTFRLFIFKQCLKKTIGTKKKVIFDIFFKNYRTFCPENSDLNNSCMTLTNGKNQAHRSLLVKNNFLCSQQNNGKNIYVKGIRLSSEEACLTVKELSSKFNQNTHLELK